MNYQLTNEQANRLHCLLGASQEKGRVASEWLSANLPAPVPVLRPIQEMPPKVPEGCVRCFGFYGTNGEWEWATPYEDGITHFTDDRLPPRPDPEAELRREFEKWAGEEGLDLSWSDGYTDACTAHAWNGFRAGKEAGCR